MTNKELIEKLRKKFRRERYRTNKLIKHAKYVPDAWHQEVRTWLWAEKILDDVLTEIS